MTEVEIKAMLTAVQYDNILSSVRDYGYDYVCELEECDVYMNGIDRDFIKTDEALRVRRTNNKTLAEQSAYITYKGPKQDDVSMTRKELETLVSDADTAQDMLEQLGFHAVLQVVKHRFKFTSGAVALYLDHVEGLGFYLELEQIVEDGQNYDAALSDLLDCLRELEVAEASMERRSYLEMLMRKNFEI